MSSPPNIEVTDLPKRFPPSTLDSGRPGHHLNDSKTLFGNPWPSFRYAMKFFILCPSFTSVALYPRFQSPLQWVSVRALLPSVCGVMPHIFIFRPVLLGSLYAEPSCPKRHQVLNPETNPHMGGPAREWEQRQSHLARVRRCNNNA
jgi:hypothetical protein